MNAPEKIALKWAEGAAVTSGPLMEHEAYTRFIREDVAQAMAAVAAEKALEAIEQKARDEALEEAANWLQDRANTFSIYNQPDAARMTRTHTHAEAIRALKGGEA